MTRTVQAGFRLVIATVAGLVAGVLVGLPFGGVATAAPPANLSVALTDGVGQVTSHTDVTYTAMLANGGSKRVTMRLVVTVPGYVTVTKADGATVGKHEVTWTVAVPAGRSAKRTLAARIGTISNGQLRVTTLASVYQGAAADPLIRTADADRIAGVTDPAHTVGSTGRPRGDSGPKPLLVVGAPLLAVALAGGGLLLWRRRQPIVVGSAQPPGRTDRGR